jgi:hypothetical protein
MLFLESKKDIEQRLRDVKHSLMTPDPINMAPELFPEFFAPEEIRALEAAPDDAVVEIQNTVTDAEVDEFLDLMGVTRR